MVSKALKNQDWCADLDVQNLRESHPFWPTGSFIIDYLIGGKPNQFGVPPCPGWPKGKVINLYGKEGSGKSTVALTASREVIRAGGTVCYIDWEHEIVPSYAAALGVPIGDEDKFLLAQPESLEDGLAILWTMATAGVDLAILDSVGAGVPKVVLEASIADTAKQQAIGLNARAWSQFFPKLKPRIKRTGTTVIGISQIRDSINTMGYGDNFTVQGGRAWKFYSALRMRLQPVKTDKADEYSGLSNKKETRVVGIKVKARLDKCKMSAQQGNEEYFYIRWGKGIDDIRSLIDIAVSHKVIKQSASWFQWVKPDGEVLKCQGAERLRDKFEETPKLFEALRKQLLPFLSPEKDEDDSVKLEKFEDDEEQEFDNLENEIGSILDNLGTSK